MQLLTREQAVQRYGAIDFAAKHWPLQRNYVEMFEVPNGMFPNWKVMDTQMPVSHIACNKDMSFALRKALESVHAGGWADLLETFDGCFAIRAVRGSNTHFSWHSYALAIDLNASINPLGSTSGGFYGQPGFVQCFKNQGFLWGGDFHGRKDPMHFQLAIG